MQDSQLKEKTYGDVKIQVEKKKHKSRSFLRKRKMRNKKGFTLIELMVVVLIVAVLAAVLIPMMTARLESARWSEGKAGAGTIATAIRAMYAEQGEDLPVSTTVTDYVNAEDLFGRYFDENCYIITTMAVPGTGVYPVTYTIRVRNPSISGSLAPGNTSSTTWHVRWWELNHTGEWTKGPMIP